jgi:hypothetical protein
MTKDFDAVAWMRRRREETDREDEGLDWRERSRKTARLLEHDPLWARLKERLLPAKDRAPSVADADRAAD